MIMSTFSTLLCMVLLGVSSSSNDGQTDVHLRAHVAPAPPGGKELWPGMQSAKFVGSEYAKLDRYVVDGVNTLKVSTFAVAPNHWDVTLQGTSLSSVKKDDVILARFSARASVDSPAFSNLVAVAFQDDDPSAGYKKSIFNTVNLTHVWQTFSFPSNVVQSATANQTALMFEFGFNNMQTIEMQNISFLNYHNSTNATDLPFCCETTYPGRESNATWRAQALERIKTTRTSNVTFTIVQQPSGQPISDCAVRATMSQSAFSFGSAVNAFEWYRNDSSAARYQSEFLRLFNTAVFEGSMKWPAWINPSDRNRTLLLTKTLQDHGVRVRGHNLVWPSCGGSGKVPASVCEPLLNDSNALENAIEQHIHDEVTTLRGIGCCEEFDVINEPYDNKGIAAVLGKGNTSYARWINAAANANPTAGRRINDDQICNGVPLVSGPKQQFYKQLFPWLVDNNASITGVGCESHLGSLIAGPESALSWFDWVQTLGLSVRITEFDIASHNESLYADIMRDLLIASYSHPAADGFLMWGFWDGCHWQKNAPIFRDDWSPKTGASVWDDYVLGRWRSNETGTTNTNGVWDAPPLHHGKYDVRVTCGTSTNVTLTYVINATTHDITIALKA